MHPMARRGAGQSPRARGTGRLPGSDEARSITHVVLVGLMGAGKSTVGRDLARLLDWDWRDSDSDIQEATGATVRELRDRLGIVAMHELEADQLIHTLEQPGPVVISAAASVVDVPRCRAAMKASSVCVIWLRAQPSVLAKRFLEGTHRPAFGDSPEEFLAEQAHVRKRRFAAVNPIVIDVDDLGPEAVARTASERIFAMGSPAPGRSGATQVTLPDPE